MGFLETVSNIVSACYDSLSALSPKRQPTSGVKRKTREDPNDADAEYGNSLKRPATYSYRHANGQQPLHPSNRGGRYKSQENLTKAQALLMPLSSPFTASPRFPPPRTLQAKVEEHYRRPPMGGRSTRMKADFWPTTARAAREVTPPSPLEDLNRADELAARLHNLEDKGRVGHDGVDTEARDIFEKMLKLRRHLDDTRVEQSQLHEEVDLTRADEPETKLSKYLIDAMTDEEARAQQRTNQEVELARAKADQSRASAERALKSLKIAKEDSKERELAEKLAEIERSLKELTASRQPVQVVVPSVSQELLDQYKFVTRGGDEAEVLVSHAESNIDIHRRDMYTMAPGTWLNDEVINVYMALLMDRDSRNRTAGSGQPKCHFFNTFFANKLYKDAKKYDYKSVRRWTLPKRLKSGGQQSESILDCDFIIVPVHQAMHWVCAVINLRDQKFIYLDSLKGEDHRCLDNLAQYIIDEYKDKKKEDRPDVESWPREFPKDIPEQRNGCDCGVFTILFANFMSQERPMKFAQGDIQNFRVNIVYDILRLQID